NATQAEMWVISADRQTVRLHIPPVRLASLAEPLKLHLDWNATAVDEILDRLTVLRSQMDPPPIRS
ncbi:MAG TPA: hypothetical protein VK595_15150, partial [Vicinamibacterales bacterium]|nr:hypothetical protein [Vicinamibacterales bacterium]